MISTTKNHTEIGAAFMAAMVAIANEYSDAVRIDFFMEDSELIMETLLPDGLCQAMDPDLAQVVRNTVCSMIEERMREAVCRRMESMDSRIGEFVRAVEEKLRSEFVADTTIEKLRFMEEAQDVLSFLKLETEEFKG